MRRVKRWVCGLFYNSWVEFLHFLMIFGACIAGMVSASVFWIVIVAGALSLTSSYNWGGLIGKASRIDGEYRELGRRLWPYDPLKALSLYAGSSYAAVIGAHMLNNLFFCVGLRVRHGERLGWGSAERGELVLLSECRVSRGKRGGWRGALI
jgi:hypothetical protein